jgi:hypothetical protein
VYHIICNYSLRKELSKELSKEMSKETSKELSKELWRELSKGLNYKIISAKFIMSEDWKKTIIFLLGYGFYLLNLIRQI